MLFHKLYPGFFWSSSHDRCHTALDARKERSELDPEATNQEMVRKPNILNRHCSTIDQDLKPLKLHLLILLKGEPDFRLFKVFHELDASTELILVVLIHLTAWYLNTLESFEAFEDRQRLLPQLSAVLPEILTQRSE